MLQREARINEPRREGVQGANAQESSKLRPGTLIGDGYVLCTVAQAEAYIRALAKESAEALTTKQVR